MDKIISLQGQVAVFADMPRCLVKKCDTTARVATIMLHKNKYLKFPASIHGAHVVLGELYQHAVNYLLTMKCCTVKCLWSPEEWPNDFDDTLTFPLAPPLG